MYFTNKTVAGRKDIQRQLKVSGYYNGRLDGDHGPRTKKALFKFQLDNGLFPDGLFGPRTGSAMTNIYKNGGLDLTKSITHKDILRAAKLIKVPTSMIVALMLKETRGDGFTASGKPKILFERHWFRKFLIKGGFTDYQLRKLRVNNSDIINHKAGGYTQSDEYQRFERAKAIDSNSAFNSISMGKFQIMGFNHEVCGYKTARSMYLAACKSENVHLNMLINFIKNTPGLRDAMEDRDYKRVARIYNGPGYAKNNYDVSLKEYSDLYEEVMS